MPILSRRRLSVVCGLIAAHAIGVAGAAPTGVGVTKAARPARERELTGLREELALAQAKGFYLRLDPRRRLLTLCVEGVALATYPLARVEQGTPRVLFWPRSAAAGWELAAHRHGRLDPPRKRDRIEVVAPPAGKQPVPGPTAPPIPPTAEESYSVPERFRVVFDGGLTLEVRAPHGARNRRLLQRLADARRLWLDDLSEALGCSPGAERVRLRIELAPKDAGALYRSLPPDVALVMGGLEDR